MKKLVSILLTLSILLIGIQGVCAGDTQLTELKVTDSSIKDDGVIRVFLKSLSSPTNLTLTLDGVYTVEHDAGIRFERGTQVVLSCADGAVYMTTGGLTMFMGTSVTLTREASDSDTNGIRIAEAQYKDNLYEGDLKVFADESGGLSSILTINIEDYLLGVVAYEMSDSWPVEALKAQAVAARTYVMQKKSSSSSRDYDVVDTTADQVFKGHDASYTNVQSAVEATCGIVGTYKGKYATCYYTASNGGEIAIPADVWSSDGDYGYLERRVDPYDLENSYSSVKSIFFSEDASEAPALKDMLQAGLDALGRDDEIEFESIVSVEAVDPVADGSIMCRTLRFTVTATGLVNAYRPAEGDSVYTPGATGDTAADIALRSLVMLERLIAAQPYVETRERASINELFTVDLDMYSDVKDNLGLNINSGDYEIITPDYVNGVYTLTARRFGHGVGMSQRGAQMMAGQHGCTYLEILGFYYPGITLEKVSWDTPVLSKLDELPENVGVARPEPTPTPTPAPLPQLEGDEYYAVVTLGSVASALNVREQPTTASQIKSTLAEGRRVIVCSEEDENGWVAIRTAELDGFVKLEYLRAE